MALTRSPSPAQRVLARALSILGHPALLMPGAVVMAALARDSSPSVLWAATAASLAAALAVGVYSIVQVRRGGWQHVDASVPGERQQLNRFLVPLLWGLAALLALSGQPAATVLGMALGGAIVVCAQALRRWMKLSLHGAFAVFAASLLWPLWPAVLGLLGLAAGVLWSRLVLGRHTVAEVMAGALVGGLAGWIWVVWVL
jgi:membrane-associated phospholipid phosphatase